MIRIEFWNGQTSNKPKYMPFDGLVFTSHNPCLWTNAEELDKPWRKVYAKAIEFVEEWKSDKINPTELLHSLRYVAYGYNHCGEDKRAFDDTQVIWPGNLTTTHRPKLTYLNENTNEKWTLYFTFENYEETNAYSDSTKNQWAICVEEDQAIFYWK